MHFKFRILKIYCAALISLSAILSGAIFSAFFQSNAHRPAEMVYCPLTKKLQPVNPPQSAATSVLDEICATNFEKNRLSLAMAENVKIRLTNLNQLNLENLAFDFWQKGKSAFDSLPNTPNAPEKFLVKNSFSIVGFGSNFEIKGVWKTSEKFAFQSQPRPPTEKIYPEFNFEFVSTLDKISRRIAPRAPPFAV